MSAGQSIQFGRFTSPDDAAAAAAVAEQVRQQLGAQTALAVRATARRVFADRLSGQMQLPLGDGPEFGRF